MRTVINDHIQRDIAKLEADVAHLERRVEAAASISQISDQVKLKSAELSPAGQSVLWIIT